MESRARIFILCLLCVGHASEVLPSSEEVTEFKARELAFVEDLSRIPVEKTDNETNRQSTDKLRDKRALGLLLSGLAQIFGYAVTPIQLASLPNPNITRPAMSNSSMMGMMGMGQQTASSRPSMNTTMTPRQQETIRFTGVLNFGNNSDIIGHLQRYEQIFHGPRNNTMMMPMMMTTSRPTPMPMPMPPAKISVDPRTNAQTKPPLLTPFFVKIPIPIAPDLPPATIPIESFKLSYPAPPIQILSESSEDAETPIQMEPVRKEQETVYRNNENDERYTVEEKEIYDEKDVRKMPMSKYIHQLYIDEPSWNNQQNERYNELQRKEEERVERLKEQEEQRNRDKNTHYREDERNAQERDRNREEEIVNRNREHVSKQKSTEKKIPAYNDEENEYSAERYEGNGQVNLPSRPSKQPESNEREKIEDYPNYDDIDDPKKNSNKQPENFDKYVEVGYNQRLPIGEYFHEANPEVIRDSYGEVLNNKKQEDDRLADYINMFKHLYTDVQDPRDALTENGKETFAPNGYNEHLVRVEKLRKEYALPENKYEEYDISDESEIDKNSKESERIQNLTPAKPKRPQTPAGSKEVLHDDAARSENTKSQKEVDFARYTPLVVPIRYIDANDKVQQATIQQLNYKEALKLPNSQFSVNNNPTVSNVNLIPQIGLPERPRQLHEGEHKELQIWPPPFDYAVDNTEPANTIIPLNSQNYPQNYHQHVKNIAANEASNDKSPEQPSGYLVVVGNPIHPYQYPYNVYYLPNEAANPQNPDPHLNAEGTHPRNQIHIHQQIANQQLIQANPNLTAYNLNETVKNPHNYYYQSQNIPNNILDRYRYIFKERAIQVKDSPNIDTRSKISDMENWSSRIYQSQSRDNTDERSPLVLAQLHNVAPSSQNIQSRASEKPRNSRTPRRRKSTRTEGQRKKNDEKSRTSSRQPILKNKSFNDPESAHDFFGFSKDDYSFNDESNDASNVAEENEKTTKKSRVLVAPEPIAYLHDDESLIKYTDELENNPEKVKVKEYRNKVATLKVSEQRQLKPNGPIHYVDFVHTI